MPAIRQSKTDRKLLEQVNQDYIWAMDYREDFRKDWLRYYRMYRSRLPDIDTGGDQKYPFESNVVVPYIFSVIETQLPLVMQQLFGAGKFAEVSGRKVDDEINAPIVNEIIGYQFERDIEIFRTAYLWSKQALIYGTSPVAVDWMYRTRLIRQRVPQMTLAGTPLGERTVRMNKVINNNPTARVIDIFRYFQCPTTPGNPATDDNVLYAGWEFNATLPELIRDHRAGFYNRKVFEITKTDGSELAERPLEDRLGVLGKTGPLQRNRDHRSIIPCIKYFGQVPDGSGNLVLRDIVVAYPTGLPQADGGSGEGIIIRNEENPFFHDHIPIVLCRVNMDEGELYGQGDIEAVESLQIELQDQRNQRNDNIVRQMDKMFKVRRSANIDEAQLQFRPSGIVEVDEMGDIEELVQNPAQLANAFTEEEVIKRDIQFATGISDFVVGQFQNSSGFNDTATGISLIQSAAQNRIVLKTQFIQTAVKDLAEMVWALDQQFLNFDTVFKVLNPNSASKYRFIRATPDVIRGQYDFTIVNASASGNPQIKRQQIIQVMQAMGALIPAAQEAGQQININYGSLLKRLFEEFDIPNIAEIFPGVAQTELVNDVPEGFGEAEGPGTAMDPEMENQLFLAENAKDLPVNPADNDIEHIISHTNAEKVADVNQQDEIRKHVSLHQQQLAEKKESLIEENTAFQEATTEGPSPSGLVNDSIQNSLSSPNGAGGQEEIVRRLASSGGIG